ncbi:MAG: hypothetical protein KH706_09070, partial [Faecalibacterium prausnitzii]|nr:hypothetical protein [Faecalibacterium prausnitzii]
LDYFITFVIVCQALFSEAWKLFSGHEMNLSGPISLLLSLSEVILSGGPWRSSIIPHAGAGVNTFLQFSLHFISIRSAALLLYLTIHTGRPYYSTEISLLYSYYI